MDQDQFQPQNLQTSTANQAAGVPTKTKVTFPQAVKKKSKKKVILPVIIILLLFAGTAAAYFFRDKLPFLSSEELTPTPTESQNIITSIPTPSPTPKPEIERSDIKIEVLNGTGIPGEAGYLQEKLESLGYSDIDIGNSSKQDYEAAKVTFDEDLEVSAKNEILDLLEDLYSDVDESSKSLTTEDVQIITGLRPGQDFPPTNTPTSEVTPTPTTSVTPTTTETTTPSPTETSTPTPTP